MMPVSQMSSGQAIVRQVWYVWKRAFASQPAVSGSRRQALQVASASQGVNDAQQFSVMHRLRFGSAYPRSVSQTDVGQLVSKQVWKAWKSSLVSQPSNIGSCKHALQSSSATQGSKVSQQPTSASLRQPSMTGLSESPSMLRPES